MFIHLNPASTLSDSTEFDNQTHDDICQHIGHVLENVVMARNTKDGPAPKRGRGRPTGGGNSAPQAQTQILDAAERLFIRQGFAATTMEAIALEAGYSRAVMYRHFRNRDQLLEALVVRVTLTQITQMAARLLMLQDLAEIMTESLVIVATEVRQNPILRVLSEHDEKSSVATLIVTAPNLVTLLGSMYEGLFKAQVISMRPGLQPADAAQYVLGVALSLLMDAIPGADDAAQVRRYVRVFVLPALLAEPPAAEPVFPQ